MPTRTAPEAGDIARRILSGEERALARLLTALEDAEPWSAAALRMLRKDAGTRNSRKDADGDPTRGYSMVIGITGAPGTGKSTLVDKLITHYRGRGEKVGVLAVDPSSPFTGGAILGDRIRMQGRSPGMAGGSDEGVFIRSLASRGRLGGLSRASAQCSRALEAAGYGVVLVETVGIGQSEVDIARLADIVVLVAMPGSGDDIQTIKAGVMEIGDVFVVNKADREGADKAVREIRSMLELAGSLAGSLAGATHAQAAPAGADGLPPVLKTIAETGEGVLELAAVLDARWAKLEGSGGLEARRKRGAVAEARALLHDRVMAELGTLREGLEEALAEEIVKGEREAGEAADLLFDSIRKGVP